MDYNEEITFYPLNVLRYSEFVNPFILELPTTSAKVIKNEGISRILLFFFYLIMGCKDQLLQSLQLSQSSNYPIKHIYSIYTFTSFISSIFTAIILHQMR